MRSGRCPKCSSTELFHAVHGGLMAECKSYVRLSHVTHDRQGSSLFESYLCGSCGFIEMYAVLGDPAFAQITTDGNWERVQA